MKPYQIWIKFKVASNGYWCCVFSSHDPSHAKSYATNNVCWNRVSRIELRDLGGPLETLHDENWN
jgi:hypothetical protein